MPFNALGMRPDVVMNPHAFPSRMTVGQVMEMAGAKIAACTGSTVSGACWNHASMEELAEGLTSHGARSGKERMYSGTTGQMIREPIFMAPCWYQRLPHLAQEKCYARGASGPVDAGTGQPTSGRRRGGGMRLGEMERDVLLGAGAAAVLEDRMQCIMDRDGGGKVPGATKLLQQELFAMGIHMDIES